MALTKEWLEEEYHNKNRSFADIATELGTYANAVRRAALKFGIRMKNKSEAQSAAIKSSRHPHPTKGTTRSKETKIAIANGVSQSWKDMSETDYEQRVKLAQDNWNDMSFEQKRHMQSLAIEAVRKTSREGSKLEKFIVNTLREQNYVIEFHKKGILANNKLEVDIFMPTNGIAIEVDGPSHFLPIWGQEALLKTVKADNEKNGLLIHFGLKVIRIKQSKKNLSTKDMRDVATLVIAQIEEIKKLSKKEGAIFEIEVQE